MPQRVVLRHRCFTWYSNTTKPPAVVQCETLWRGRKSAMHSLIVDVTQTLRL